MKIIPKIKQLVHLILFLLYWVGLGSFYFQTEDEIEWNENRKLTWEDFKGEVPTGRDSISAVTAVSINVKCCQWKGNIGKASIIATFDTHKSWARKNGGEFLLKHEQGHFDIVEIYARKLRKKLDGKKIKRSTASKKIQCIIDEIELEKDTYQLLYDKETNLSRNIEKQKEWNLKIAKELKSLEKYKKTEVTIILKGRFK